MRGSLRINVSDLTELNSAISVVHFSFATVFQYLNFVRFRSYSELNFS